MASQVTTPFTSFTTLQITFVTVSNLMEEKMRLRLQRVGWRIPLDRILFAAILSFSSAAPVWAEESFSELEFFQEEAGTVTASRRLQPVREAPVAVEVITEEEIAASGATTLWDLLRFRVGMDVLDGRAVDGNRGIVSVRGFPQEYVNNLQVLVDGRSVYNTYSGGVYWPQLPVQMQDIERIEVVRGPNGALYGSNAGLGVINIITKKPGAQRLFSIYGLRGNVDLFQAGTAYESAGDRFGYRLSYSFWNENGYPSATIDPNPFFPIPPPDDFYKSHKTHFRSYFNPSAATHIELLAGGSWDESGLSFDREGKFRNGFGMLKLSQQLGAAASLDLMAARTTFDLETSPDFEGVLDLDYDQYDFEAIHHFSMWNDRLKTTWGGNYRISIADSNEAFRSAPVQKDRLRRGFVQQSIGLIEEVTLVAAVSLEHTDTGGTEPAYQAALLYAPSDRHAFRASYSVAPTIPSLWESRVDRQSAQVVVMEGNPDLEPQKLSSYEVGYLGDYLKKRLRVETNFFYMKIDDLSTSFTKEPANFFVFPPTPNVFSFDNRNDATAKGAELKLAYRFAPGRLVHANYTMEHIEDELGDIRINDGTPAHKVNLGTMAVLAGRFSVNIQAGYKSTYRITTTSDPTNPLTAPPYWRVDARLGYYPMKHVEIFVVGKNLASPYHREFADSLKIPKTYYGGVSMIY
jgi:iron complex outermembrane receptor protein